MSAASWNAGDADLDDAEILAVAAPPRINLAGACRILLIGHGRHGKDFAGEILSARYGMRAVSSSAFCAQKAVFPLVSDLYPDWAACYEDRANHRELWFHAIAAYNLRPGPTLAEQILAENDIYTGMRRRAELAAAREFFDLVVWVDASERLPLEPSGSMELTADDADWILDNNGAPEDLVVEVDRLVAHIVDQMSLADAFARHG
ncbi:hypothetical protein [Roseovarius sp. C03]|uniref:hypothetical protein n=1 Tax=Roseovarius sp. C03 TaxID=3449222 RepID=UPI003EDC1D33